MAEDNRRITSRLRRRKHPRQNLAPARAVDQRLIGDLEQHHGRYLRRNTMGSTRHTMPTTPLIRRAYQWYFNRVLPGVGRLVSRHNAAYAYLPASVGAFASPEEFMQLLRQAGFDEVRAIPLTFGIVYLYTARKRA